jgi:mannonate dehydratase
MALQKTWRWFGQKDSVSLAELRQMGVEGVVTALHSIPAGQVWPLEAFAREERN